MMSLETINYENRRRARVARKEGIKPYILKEGDLEHIPPFPFPYIGEYRPKGYKLVQTFFVDSSGFGSEDEPALTIDAFCKRLKVGYGYAVISAGEFQVYVGEFKKKESVYEQ